jgi:hypothetical protein
MSNLKTMLAIIAVLAIGPVMYIAGRGNSLSGALEKVQVGDSPQAVIATMGHPQEEARASLYLRGDTEYRYSTWPLPGVWVVSFKDGKVLEKSRLSSR